MSLPRDKQIYLAYKVIKKKLDATHPYTSHILALTSTAQAFGISFFDIQSVVNKHKGKKQ